MEQDKEKKTSMKVKVFFLGIGMAGGGIWLKFGIELVMIFTGLVIAALAYAAMIHDCCEQNKTLSKGDGQG